VRGTIVARPAANLLIVRHDEIPALGMRAMELMTIFTEPSTVDQAGVQPGERVRLAVRQRDNDLVLLWVERLR
jgi:copper binding protein CusF